MEHRETNRVWGRRGVWGGGVGHFQLQLKKRQMPQVPYMCSYLYFINRLRMTFQNMEAVVSFMISRVSEMFLGLLTNVGGPNTVDDLSIQLDISPNLSW